MTTLEITIALTRLEAAGYIEKTGEFRKSPSGKMQPVYPNQ